MIEGETPAVPIGEVELKVPGLHSLVKKADGHVIRPDNLAERIPEVVEAARSKPGFIELLEIVLGGEKKGDFLVKYGAITVIALASTIEYKRKGKDLRMLAKVILKHHTKKEV